MAECSTTDLDQECDDLSLVTVDMCITYSEVVPTKGLLDILEKEKYTDVTFLVEDQQFKAHRVIVASQSDYFDRLLFGSMKEAGCSEVRLEETSANAFNYLLKYMYSSSVRTLDLQTALDLLSLADRYCLEELKSLLETQLCLLVSNSTVLQFLFYAEAFNADKLQHRCMEFIECNTHTILLSTIILSLPLQHFKSLLSRDQLLVDELDVFHAVQRWVKHNDPTSEERRNLLECVRLPQISSDELMEKVMPSGLFDMSTISKALEIQDSTIAVEQVMPRGRIGLNLFDDDTTDIIGYENFRVQVYPDCFGELRDVPSDFEFKLLYRASTEYSAITFQFQDIYIINELKFKGYPHSWSDDEGERQRVKEPFCYKIQVSKDHQQWVTVADHSKFKCYLTQQLYFHKQAARYVRLVLVRGHEFVTLRFLSCSSTAVGSDPPFRYPNGVLAPLSPLKPAVVEHVCEIDIGNGRTGQRCFLTFHQPYSISLIKFKISGLTGTAHVTVCVSLQNKAKSYQTIANLKHHDLEHDLQMTFQERVVCIVNITIQDLIVKEKGPVSLRNNDTFSVQELIVAQAITKL